MPHFGTLQDYTFKESADDIRGAALYDVKDDKLGTIDDVIFDHSTGEIRYAVVDTGGLLRHKRFLVPADRIHNSEDHRGQFQVDILKEHVERYLPLYDLKAVVSETDWNNYEEQYRRGWHDGVVLHRHGSDRTITPLPGELPSEPTGDVSRDADVSGYDVEPHRLAGKFPDALQSSSKLQMVPEGVPERTEQQAYVGSSRVPAQSWEQNQRTASSGPSIPVGKDLDRTDRWRRFEDLLKKNRVDIQAKCPSCAPKKAA